ncbi:MAG: glycogen debranching enzyme GlgX, partial [Alphaproteobacteria bacterium]|nr:glycogen debranching enzyme GlgX [Alphaproteobacteria bacterium]
GSSGFLDAVRQDPVLSRTKLIAEPWDLGGDGYRLGGFPPGWSEWNGRYRDTVRKFWSGEGGLIGDVASRITGSSDLFSWGGRRPWASLNFVTAHDGFTLHDMLSYNHKHNEANLEGNADGHSDNNSWNCGAEGPTDDPQIKALRLQQTRNYLATLLLSQGIPMFVAGDEFGRSQNGNNNAYCQDSEISWLDWSLSNEDDRSFLEFVKLVIRLRKSHAVFRRPAFFRGIFIPGTGAKDICWISPAGREMNSSDWSSPFARCLGFLLGGTTGDVKEDGAATLQDERFLVLMNAHDGMIDFHLPPTCVSTRWSRLFDTARPDEQHTPVTIPGSGFYPLEGRSMVLLIGDRRKSTESLRRRRIVDLTTQSQPPRRGITKTAVVTSTAQHQRFRIRVRSTSRIRIMRKRQWSTGKL